LRFDNAFVFNINCEKDIDLDETLIPSLLLQPFIENSIKHGIADIEMAGKIIMDIRKSNDKILIAIDDNGKGRKQDNRPESNFSKHKSYGTSLTMDRISAYNKAFNRNITVKIIDLTDENELNNGTRVEILI
jgi:LytS/YehU family sensor histidine kinase